MKNRELKFRAWDTLTDDWYDGTLEIDFDWGGIVNEAVDLMNLEEGRYIVMQYTGLKDKNGKEIYEGDILRTGTDKDMVVGWSERFASFVIHREGWAFQHWFGEACDPEDCEVIGNIYEHPELLKQREDVRSNLNLPPTCREK